MAGNGKTPAIFFFNLFDARAVDLLTVPASMGRAAHSAGPQTHSGRAMPKDAMMIVVMITMIVFVSFLCIVCLSHLHVHLFVSVIC